MLDYAKVFAEDDEVGGLKLHEGDPGDFDMAKKKMTEDRVREEVLPEDTIPVEPATTFTLDPKPEVKVTKADAVRKALTQLGLSEKPQTYVDWIKLHYELEIDTQTFGTYKSNLKKEFEDPGAPKAPAAPRIQRESRAFASMNNTVTSDPTMTELKAMKELIKTSRGGVEDLEEVLEALKEFRSIEIFGKALEFWKENQE